VVFPYFLPLPIVCNEKNMFYSGRKKKGEEGDRERGRTGNQESFVSE
jgi:hypothetical protein